MKILYTKGSFTDSPQQVLFYGVNLENRPVEFFQKKLECSFPDSCSTKDKIFENALHAQPAIVGDVVWTESSGRKHIGHAILQSTPNDDINLGAVEVCFRSLEKKCKELGQKSASIPLIVPKNDLFAWKEIYPVIEEVVEDTQVIVHIPNEADLFDLLDVIGGDIKQYNVGKSGSPIVRFRTKSDK